MITELEIIQAQPPEATYSYQPVSHSVLLETVQEKLYKHGYNVTDKRYQANGNCSQLFAVYDLENSNSDTKMNLGFRNSYDKSLAVGFVSGATVIVCSNFMFQGDIKLLRKHTKRVFNDLDRIVEEVITQSASQYDRLSEDGELMKTRLLNKREMAELAGRMYIEEKLVNPTQMNILAREIRNSQNFQGETLWDFYNHTTEALKKSHPSEIMQNHIQVHDFVMELV